VPGRHSCPPFMPRLIKDAQRYKTVLCANWVNSGCCDYKHKCQFAHGVEELRVRRPAARTPAPSLKERSVALGGHLDLRLSPDTPIPEVISVAINRVGLKQKIDALPTMTLPEKMELVCEAAGMKLPEAPAPAAAESAPAAPAPTPALPPPAPPALATPSEPSTRSATPLPPMPPPPKAVRGLFWQPNVALDQCQPADGEEEEPCDITTPFFLNAAGKIELHTPPGVGRQVSHATESLRRTISFILDEPCDGGTPAQDIWAAAGAA